MFLISLIRCCCRQVNCLWGDRHDDSAVTSCKNEPHYNITGLEPYTNYIVEIVAVNPGGCSEVKTSDVLQTGEWCKL